MLTKLLIIVLVIIAGGLIYDKNNMGLLFLVIGVIIFVNEDFKKK